VKKYGRERHGRQQNIIRRIRFACWIDRSKSTQSENVQLIALARQLEFHNRTAVLHLHVQFLSCLCYSLQIVLLNYKNHSISTSNVQTHEFKNVCIFSSKRFNAGNYLQEQRQ
jgi:hypothetical protein